MRGKIAAAVFVVIVIAALLILSGTFFSVSEIEYAIVIQFGKPVKTITQPGLKIKIPLIQEVIRLEKRVISWNGDEGRMPTRDKKNIFVTPMARWRISDPLLFYKSVRNIDGGHKKLDDLVDSYLRDVVGRHNLINVVRTSNRDLQYETEELARDQKDRVEKVTYGRGEMEQEIKNLVRASLKKDFGIEIIDVRIQRLNYVERVQQKVFDRMIAERQRIASLYLSEAQEQKEIILGNSYKELAEIEGEGEQKSREMKGKADAEAIRILGEAIAKTKEFYGFLRTLEAYKNSFDKDTELILTTDSEFFKFIKSIESLEPKE